MTESAPPPSFYHNGNKVFVEFNYKNVMVDFKKMGLNLFDIYNDQRVIMQIFGDDETMIQVWFFYIKDYEASYDEAIERLEVKELQTFKEAFWSAVVNFSAPQMRAILIETKTILFKYLTDPSRIREELQKKISGSSSSELSPELE